MALAQRKEKILAAVVESYIETGEPIGSKAVLKSCDLGVSSATVRSELNALDLDGYLTQPHTSAGRIPTKKGYRYYIDNLMEEKEPEERVKKFLEREIITGECTPEMILKRTSSALSKLSGFAAVTTTPSPKDARVHKIRFVSTGRHSSMVVLVTSNGNVKSRLFRCEFVLTPELLSMFDKALNEKFAGVKLCDINRAFLQTAASSMGELSLFIPDVLMALYDAIEQARQISVSVSGATNLLFSDGYDFVSARNAIGVLSNAERISGLINNIREAKIIIGEESSIRELSDISVTAARYELSDENAGAVAVIAPLRADYRKLLREVIYASKVVSAALSAIIER